MKVAPIYERSLFHTVGDSIRRDTCVQVTPSKPCKHNTVLIRIKQALYAHSLFQFKKYTFVICQILFYMYFNCIRHAGFILCDFLISGIFMKPLLWETKLGELQRGISILKDCSSQNMFRVPFVVQSLMRLLTFAFAEVGISLFSLP